MPKSKPLTIALLVFAAALGLFLLLATFVAPHPPMALDRAITEGLYREAKESPDTQAFLRIVTGMGDWLVLTVMGISIAVVMLWWRQWLLALTWLAVLLGAAVLNAELKDVYQR